MTVTYTDNFDRASLGSDWTMDQGTASIVSNQFKASADGDDMAYYSAMSETDDMTVTCDVVSSFGSPYAYGPWARWGDGGSWPAAKGYFFYSTSSPNYLFRQNTSGPPWSTSLGTWTGTGSATIAVSAIGNDIKATIDGTDRITAVDSTYGGATYKAGVYFGSADAITDDWSAECPNLTPRRPTPTRAGASVAASVEE